MNLEQVTSAAGVMRLIQAPASYSTVIRAERLQMRAMGRAWSDDTLAALLRRLTQHRLARTQNGRGSAGQCPATTSAKTPAAGEQVRRDAASNKVHLARASHGPAMALSEHSLRRHRAGAFSRGTP